MFFREWLTLATLLALAPIRGADDKAAPARPVPKEVAALIGTYTGEWTLFGLKDNGDVAKRFSWTDTIKSENARVEGDRALVSIEDAMNVGGDEPVKMTGKEGYYLTKDGGLGDYFTEMHGQTRRMVRVADNVWSYAAAVSPQELQRLGLPAGTTAQHVLVKVVNK